jgi:hypothetical protein
VSDVLDANLVINALEKAEARARRDAREKGARRGGRS